ncbi:MAG: UDP-N-acetylmuramoyl-L-alanine--D-glutamate ligase, partial [Saprospiraceae bacterium]|nr:UDP-N-acetylmuramoyl-L-alanine--D-glutamate ligase [Saprospiraceae bacterium]
MGEMVVILGGGESGVGAALLAKAKGFHVFLSDSGTIPAAYREELLRAEIPFEEEGHFSPVLQEAERVIKSPGIPGDHILVQSYRQRGVIVESEISFAARFLSGRIVGITGTNGKTTTTHLVDHLFRSAGFNTGCGGNIGYGMSRLALEPPKDWYVLELSSFQLEDTGAFRPDIAIILNLTPDHLDRYGNRMEAYADAKWNITLNQKEEDLLIFQAGNPYLEEVAQSRPSRARQVRVGNAAGVSGSWLEVDADRYDLRKFVLQGDHNLYNTTCAILAARHAGIAASRIQQALPSFRPVRHRME